jgi:hypothetical protein
MLLHQVRQFSLFRQHRQERTNKFVVIMCSSAVVDLQKKINVVHIYFFCLLNKYLVFILFIIFILQIDFTHADLVLQISQKRQQILRRKRVRFEELRMLLFCNDSVAIARANSRNSPITVVFLICAFFLY